MTFLQYLWRRAEFHTKFAVMLFTLVAVLVTVALTYGSVVLYRSAQAILFLYLVYIFGYEIIYKQLKQEHAKFLKDQNQLFDKIKEPK